MIVKNEAPVIRRCLASVMPFIDRWCIVDTGSTDYTQTIVCEFMAYMPGSFHERPWVNFGHNRTEAMKLAQEHETDFTFVIDADETLDIPEGFERPFLDRDSYMLTARYGGSRYQRNQLVRSLLPWRWEGVVHEYLTCSNPSVTHGALDWPQIVVSHDGARAHDPSTYIKDAKLLETALRKEPSNARNQFYLAQSYRDAGWVKKAISAYQKRTKMGGWEEEVLIAKFEIGRMLALLKEWPEAIDAYLRAYNQQPNRAESLFNLAMHYHHAGQNEVAYLFMQRAMLIPMPDTGRLFVDASVYDYLLPLEFAVVCYWTGRHEEAVTTADKLLASGKLPVEHRALVENNRGLSLQALGRTV